jgi:hypothetical protein
VEQFSGGAGDPAALAAAPELAAAIDDVLARREEAAQVEKREREAERIRDGAAAEAKRWTEYLSLTTYQQEQLSGLLATRNLRGAEIKRGWASGDADSEGLGRAWRSEEAAFREGLEGLLTPVQLGSWDAAQAGRGKE